MQKMIAYLRVSTDKQGEDGLGIAAQQDRVRQIAKRHGICEDAIDWISEVESGRNRARRGLAEAVAKTAADPEAVLVVAKLDRLARDVRLILELSDKLGGRVLFADFPDIAPGPVGRLMMTLLAAVAEFEARRISERTKDAMAQIKRVLMEDGVYVTKAGKRIRSLHQNRDHGGHSKGGRRMQPLTGVEYAIGALRGEGLSYAAIATQLNDKGQLTNKGQPWTAAHVHYAARRYAILSKEAL